MCWKKKTFFLKCNHVVKERGCEGNPPFCMQPRTITLTAVEGYCSRLDCAPPRSSETPVGNLTREDELPSYSQVIAEDDVPPYRQANALALAEESAIGRAHVSLIENLLNGRWDFESMWSWVFR